jgi:hypothetical protein
MNRQACLFKIDIKILKRAACVIFDPIDLLFVVEKPRTSAEVAQLRDYIKNMVKTVEISATATRIAMIQIGAETKSLLKFDTGVNVDTVVNSLQMIEDGTSIIDASTTTKEVNKLINSRRSTVPFRALFVFHHR